MHPILRLCLILAFTAAHHALAAPAADTRAIEAEISQLDATRVAALLKGDLPALERLYSDDLVYIHAAGRVDSKKQYLAMLAAGNLTYASLRYDPPARVVVAGRDTAVVTGRATIEARSKSGQITKRVLTTTTVYVRTPGGWQVVSYQGTPIQP
jgi:uncharacterized protein (TIGR02246 family)